MLPFLSVIKAFLLNKIVSARMVGLVNLAKTIPAMQACKENNLEENVWTRDKESILEEKNILSGEKYLYSVFIGKVSKKN